MNRRSHSGLIPGRVLVALLLILGAASAAVDEERWEKVRAGGVIVLFSEADARGAARAGKIIDATMQQLLEDMSLEGLGPVRVIIAESDEEFAELTDGGVPDWGVGCAIANRDLIVLKSPRIVTYPLQMEKVVVHELAHIATARVLGSVRVPRWFDEGVAMTVAGQWRLSQSSAMASAVLFNRLIPLAELEGRFPEGIQEARLAYAESFRAVEFLRSATEHEHVGGLVNAVRVAGSFDAALDGRMGMTRAGFYAAADEFFEERFGIGLLLTGWNPVLLAAGLLAVLAAVLRVRGRRRKLREWEREERVGTRVERRGNRSWQ
jgi:hypothetical protein